ncbi:GntR family transcriptional regulator [Duffyella gerundensis]|nr:GntR family transcriptional regulator [Duffyella gerundensis]
MAIKLTEKQKEIKRIVYELTRAIAQHKLRPGTRLIESQLVESLSANRNHVQSALQRLALQNIVTIAPNFGAVVSTPSRRDAREIFIARQAIEPAIVALITPEKIVAWSAEILEQQRNERAVIERHDMH